jgi:hypothetical protein
MPRRVIRMLWWAGIAYVVVFVLVLAMHVLALQMVTFPLALLRALVWPVWMITGWPNGSPLPMD